MVDVEKVVKGLVCCANPETRCSKEKCPYFDIHDRCWVKLEQDALELLKEQEPVKPKEVNMYPPGQYACGFCGHISVGSKDYHAKFCPECGRELKWDE